MVVIFCGKPLLLLEQIGKVSYCNLWESEREEDYVEDEIARSLGIASKVGRWG